MDDKQLIAALEAGDAELIALRIALKALTAAVSANFPNGEIAAVFESSMEEVKKEPEVPARVLEYLQELTDVARRAVTPE